MAVDRSRYNFNGKTRLTKKALIYEVVKKYLESSTNTVDELKNIFSEKSDFNLDMFVDRDKYQTFSDDRRSRYFKEAFKLKDGEDIYLSTQWGGEVFKSLLEKIKNNLNYDIQIYSQDNAANNMDQNLLDLEINKIKNIILYGSPGVGKTHNIKKLISLIESGVSEKEIFKIIKSNKENSGVDINDIKDRVKFITFHQSFGYEDFIEGFRPNEEGKIELVPGIFRNICNAATNNINDIESFLDDINSQKNELSFKTKEGIVTAKLNSNLGYNLSNHHTLTRDNVIKCIKLFDKLMKEENREPEISELLETGITESYRYSYWLFAEKLYQKYKKMSRKNFYLVVDEINRGNISKIFGELITLIEEDKRDTLEVTLPYSKKPFKIPSNLYIIGTMNSTDKSIALIDIALRRRFTFLKMEPKAELIENQEAKELFEKLNDYISDKLGDDYRIGHSYFMGDIDLEFVLEYKIKPLLEEYFYGDTEGLNEILEMIATP